MRSSTSRCLIAASSRRIVASRALSFARIAAFMSSLIWSFKLIASPGEKKYGMPERPGINTKTRLRACSSGFARIRHRQPAAWDYRRAAWPSCGA
ncbi:hypothetical protein ACNSZH_06225 [Burkholderia gladioli]|uniref:hypothetical protein n=1 Tax=Burkholderia gladioli TaxID=28095 RepID=UPI003B9818E5